MKSWLQNNDIEMYSNHNEGKSVVAERFVRTLKNRIYKCMTSERLPSDLSSLESKVDKLDIAKLETTPVDLSKLKDVLKNDVVKKTEYYELIKTVNSIKGTDINA